MPSSGGWHGDVVAKGIIGHWLAQAGALLEGGEPLLAFPDPRVSLTAAVSRVVFALFGFV